MSNERIKEQLLKMLSGKVGKSSDEIIKNVQSGNTDSILSGLSWQQRDRVNQILHDPEAVKKIMQDEKVQDIIRKLES